LAGIVNAASPADLKRAGPGGTWGAVEALCYLRDSEEVFIARMTRMLEEQNPTFPVVEDSLWPIDRDYLGQDPNQVLVEFTTLRKTSSEMLLEASLSDWGRTGKHPLLGRITLRDYAEHVADRDQEHLRQVRAALRLDPPLVEAPAGS
jgi:hypothetical protein